VSLGEVNLIPQTPINVTSKKDVNDTVLLPQNTISTPETAIDASTTITQDIQLPVPDSGFTLPKEWQNILQHLRNDIASEEQNTSSPPLTAIDASTTRPQDIHFPVMDSGFTLPKEWHNFYRKKYCRKTAIYTAVVLTEDAIKKCGCENVRCTTNSSKYTGKCGFCSKHMRSSCIHDDGLQGVCRSCFLKYGGSGEIFKEVVPNPG